ncbi:MAG TPA: MFS transporter [Tepidisphaeraceae bacterium]|nr:MFS transporter [Tepidisphaeraceae bacterium]
MSSSPSEPTVSLSPVPAPGTPAPGPANAPAARVPLFSADSWAPLKVELFRSLYIATSIAQIGTWVREAGGPWLMKLLTDGSKTQPEMVARVLVFSNLPICLLSIFAGALADVLDRRRLLIVTQVWMMVVSATLGLLTWAGLVTPWGLLGLTFLLGAGTAAAGPALQAVLPELVPRKDLALAINLNSVALNVARALGPALFIFVISFIPGKHGVGASFFVTAATFVASIYVLWRWERAPQRAAVHGEEMWGAIRSGFLYTVHSPANRAILLRVLTFIVPAVVMWSQVPIIATGLLGLTKQQAEQGSAMLFAFVGLGAIFGVLLMPGLHRKYKIDPVVNVCTACFAGGLILLSFVHHLWIASFIMVFLGVNWVIIPTNFNTATQKSVPLWVKGRAISFYLTVLFGSFAIGGAIWGRVTTHFSYPGHVGINMSLLIGGVSMAALLVLAIWYPLTINEGLDLSPAYKGEPPKQPWPVSTDAPAGAAITPVSANGSPVLAYSNDGPKGPLEVAMHYDVDPAKVHEFLVVMRRVGQHRRRNGASHWRLEPGERDANAVRYVEVIRYHSAAEYTRQPARMTTHDVRLLEQTHSFHIGPQPPVARQAASKGGNTGLRSGLREWAVGATVKCCDRIFDETAAAFDRFADLRERERAAWSRGGKN